MRQILVLQHHPCEVLGSIETALAQTGLDYRYIRGFGGDAIPGDPKDADGLVVLGGPLSVNAQELFPFLGDEIALIEATVGERKPVLGICLGSQLIAAALGARVHKGEGREIGWLPVYLTRAASDDRLFSGVPASFVTCVWHGDVFDLPAARYASPTPTRRRARHFATAIRPTDYCSISKRRPKSSAVRWIHSQRSSKGRESTRDSASSTAANTSRECRRSQRRCSRAGPRSAAAIRTGERFAAASLQRLQSSTFALVCACWLPPSPPC
jgi:GMP synthase-like glutamine amidotransferase